MKTAHLKISGRVQGVFFRAEAKKIADYNQLSGWVQNNDDGSVEACISGEEEAINKFIAWCRRGPEKAAVEKVLIDYTAPEKFDQFKINR